ncbi:IS630 family transposase [Orientia tsutsugamushi]|uniref:IS630 family transposase n=2 Tax=Orientia tsutsugamushi TaxID=784 RepID=A0A2U3R4N6_ORITS|nr:IS630 family transposase [Orientia tsutsugamushi]
MVKFLIESVGCNLLYLLTYSPDLHLIQYYWFKVKNKIRKVVHLFNGFFNPVSFTLQSATSFPN